MTRLHSRAQSVALAAAMVLCLGTTGEAGEPGVSLEIGAERLSLPRVRFGGKYDENQDPAPLQAPLQQDDGRFAGARVDLGLRAIVPLFGSPGILVGAKGFYAAHHNTSNTICQSLLLATACDGTSLFDPSPTANNSLGIGVGETVNYVSERNVTHWGASIEIPLGRMSIAHGGGLDYRLGVGYRSIDRKLALTSLYSLSGFNQDYRETLNTGYLGGYVGVGGAHPLARGLMLTFDAEAGMYWANTDYRGHLSQTDFAGAFSQNLSLDRDAVAFIGAVKLGLEQDFGGFRLGGFVRGEYYSYAPEMGYNQTDRSTDFPSGFGIIGRDGTHLAADNAWSLSTGARVTVPFGANR